MINVDTCPSDDELERFLGGEDFPSIATHFRECARCQHALDCLSEFEGLRKPFSLSEQSQWDWGNRPLLANIIERVLDSVTLQSSFEPDIASTSLPIALDPPRSDDMIGSLGPYDIEDEIGRGGMGIVYRARDHNTNRTVALKVLLVGSDDTRTRRRFIQEVRAAALVDHEHIVRLFATSDPLERTPYFVMEYIAGSSLAELIASRGRIPPDEAAELVAQAAEGVHAAHLAGLIHSDIKPANILVALATGRAKVGDFGLARLETETPGHSREGLLPGTPAYISPEQVRGEASPNPGTDIYSLGVTLYECLTGEPPFHGKPHRILHQVLNDEPRPPREIIPTIPRDVETICLKAMAKDPARRYATADDLANDLRRFLKREPIRARPVGTLERTWRWSRNHPQVATLIGLVTFLLLTLTVGSILAAVSINRERSLAVTNARRADEQRGLAVDALSSLVQGIQDQLATRPGTLELRRSLLEIARDGLKKVPITDSTDRYSLDVDDRAIQTLIRLGDIDFVLGRTDEAKSEFEQAARLAERVSKTDPKSGPIRRQLASAYDRVGDEISRNYSEKRIPEETSYREKAQAIRQELVSQHPDNAVYRRDLQVSRNKLAGLRIKEKKVDEAVKLYQDSLNSLRAEPVNNDNRKFILSDTRFVLARLGYCARIQGRAADAMAINLEVLQTARALCALDPENVSYLRQLAFALDYLGSACLAFGQLDEAEKAFIEFRDNRQAAVTADPADQDASRSLALAFQELGDLALRRKNFDVSRSFYQQAVAQYEKVARRDPKAVMAHRDLLIGLRRIVDLEAAAGRYSDAAAAADRELAVRTAKNVPTYPEQSGENADLIILRDTHRLIDKCIENPAFARAQETRLGNSLLGLRAVILAGSGRAPEMLETTRELLKRPNAPLAPAVVARACAIAAGNVKTDPKLRNECIKTAITALRQAAATHTLEAPLLPYLPEFQALRNDPDFIALTKPQPASKPADLGKPAQ